MDCVYLLKEYKGLKYFLYCTVPDKWSKKDMCLSVQNAAHVKKNNKIN